MKDPRAELARFAIWAGRCGALAVCVACWCVWRGLAESDHDVAFGWAVWSMILLAVGSLAIWASRTTPPPDEGDTAELSPFPEDMPPIVSSHVTIKRGRYDLRGIILGDEGDGHGQGVPDESRPPRRHGGNWNEGDEATTPMADMAKAMERIRGLGVRIGQTTMRCPMCGGIEVPDMPCGLCGGSGRVEAAGP